MIGLPLLRRLLRPGGAGRRENAVGRVLVNRRNGTVHLDPGGGCGFRIELTPDQAADLARGLLDAAAVAREARAGRGGVVP